MILRSSLGRTHQQLGFCDKLHHGSSSLKVKAWVQKAAPPRLRQAPSSLHRRSAARPEYAALYMYIDICRLYIHFYIQ